MRLNKILLFLIVLFSILLRIYELDKIPPGLFSDEVVNGYDAYSLLQTGKDSHSTTFPIIFEAKGDWREPIFNYSMIPFIVLLGLSEFAIRLTSVFWSSMIILASYLLVKEVFEERIAMLTSFFLSISPWLFIFSRIAFRAITFPFFFVFGLYLFYRGIKHDKKYICISLFIFALSFYTYATSKLFVPLFLLFLLYIHKQKLKKFKKEIFLGSILFLVATLPIFYILIKSPYRILARYNAISVFNLPIHKIFPTIVKNYLKHLSPKFLFIRGDLNTRHSVRVFGQLYHFQIPLIVLGFFISLFKFREEKYKMLLLWLFFFPIPAALTTEAIPHAIRTLHSLPIFEVLSSIAVFYAFDKLKRIKGNFKISKGLFITFIFFASVDILQFFDHYFIEYPKYSYVAFSSKFGEVIAYSNRISGEYERIILLIHSPDFQRYHRYYIAFYTKYDPKKFQENPEKIGKFCLVHNCELKDMKRVLCIVESKRFNYHKGNVIKTFYNPDRSIAFEIVENCILNHSEAE